MKASRVHFVGGWIMLLGLLVVAASSWQMAVGNLAAGGGVLWGIVMIVVGRGVWRHYSGDRLLAICMLWIFLLLSLAYAIWGYYEFRIRQTGSQAAMIAGFIWILLAAVPLPLLHGATFRRQIQAAEEPPRKPDSTATSKDDA